MVVLTDREGSAQRTEQVFTVYQPRGLSEKKLPGPAAIRILQKRRQRLEVLPRAHMSVTYFFIYSVSE